MTAQDQAAAADRLRRALLTFQAALNLLLDAERRLKGLPQAAEGHCQVGVLWPERSGWARMAR